MFKALLLTWMINAVAGGTVNAISKAFSGSDDVKVPVTVAAHESVRLGYIGGLMDNCGATLGWDDEMMVEILKRGAMHAMKRGATPEMVDQLYDVGAKDASQSFSGNQAAKPLLCSGAKREVMAYVEGMDFE